MAPARRRKQTCLIDLKIFNDIKDGVLKNVLRISYDQNTTEAR
jgi:hypothetical protein